MSLAVQINTLATRLGTEFKAIRTLIGGTGTADISALTTTDKTSLVAAINEVQAEVGGGGASATETAPGIVELATLVEMATGTDPTRVATVAGVRQERNAVKAEILDSAPLALDTLNELAAALGDDANFASTVTTSLAGKQPLDDELTAIAGLVSAADRLPYFNGIGTAALATFTAAGRALVDDADVATQRGTLSVYSQAEIGDPETDFVATFNIALT